MGMPVPKLDARTDLDETRYPHGSLARQEKVALLEVEEAWEKLAHRPERADSPSKDGNQSDVPEAQWRGQ